MYKIYHKLQDLLTVIRGTWFLLLFNGLALFTFLMLAQGQDMLLVVTENTGNGEGLWKLASLLIALFYWCVSAEFGARLLIYLTDNSGRSLAPKRVSDRKLFQGYVSRFCLFFPVVLLIVALVKVYTGNHAALDETPGLYAVDEISKGTLIILGLLFIEVALLWWLYPGGLIARASKKNKALHWLYFGGEAKDWAGKLYGMLGDVRVDIPVADGFPKILERGVELPDGITLPKSKYFVPDEANFQTAGKVSTWMYHIRARFYRVLITQLALLLVLAVLVIIMIGILFPVSWDIAIGGCAIICFAFGAWITVYVTMHFLDKAQPVPVRFLLFCWLITCSIINTDHPIRILEGVPVVREKLNDHFNDWILKTTKDEQDSIYYRVGKPDSIPVIFISAEGGALRTGAFTGLLLAQLQQKFPLFKNYIYAYSSVSGGTLGADFFNAQLIRNTQLKQDTSSWHAPAKLFFKTDFMSAVTAKLVFGEIINYFWPRDLGCSDRAIALEQSYELGWENAYGNKQSNLLSGNFDVAVGKALPALFINTTEVETGLQNVWSNVKLDGIPLSARRDLYTLQATPIRYSSAINLSDRFPLISPGGAFVRKLKDKNGRDSLVTRHFVDGGYYENKGSETLLQVLKALHLDNRKIKPYILQFNFGGDTVIHSVTKFNEFTEVIGSIYNTRSGRGKIAEEALRGYVDSLHGVFIPLTLKLDGNQLPMNWVLSNTVVERLDKTLATLVALKDVPPGLKLLDSTDSGQFIVCSFMIKIISDIRLNKIVNFYHGEK